MTTTEKEWERILAEIEQKKKQKKTSIDDINSDFDILTPATRWYEKKYKPMIKKCQQELFYILNSSKF